MASSAGEGAFHEGMELKREHLKAHRQKRKTVLANEANVLSADQETEKLFVVLCNYLSLAQFELARTVLDQLFELSPEKVARVLRALVLADIPTNWLFSEKVPSAAHLAWLAYVEYRSLYERVRRAGRSEMGDSKDWSALRGRMVKTPVNPLGFVSHEKFLLRVLEAKNLTYFDKDEFLPGPPRAYYVAISVESNTLRTKHVSSPSAGPSSASAGSPAASWDEEFTCHVVYADSKLEFAVVAIRDPSPSAKEDTSSNGNSNSEEVIGRCVLPLSQLRNKEEYHIWIPLENPLPAEDQSVINNPYHFEHNRRRGQGLSQVAKPHYGKLRVRFTWTPDQSFRPGHFPRRTVESLETDLLLAATLYNGRRAYFARLKGDALAVPHSIRRAQARRKREKQHALQKARKAQEQGSDEEEEEKEDADDDAYGGDENDEDEELALLQDGAVDDHHIDGSQMDSNAPLLSETHVSRIREYAYRLLSAANERNPLLRMCMEKQRPDGFLGNEVFLQLRRAIRALPPAAHSLCGKLQQLLKESALAHQFNFDMLQGDVGAPRGSADRPNSSAGLLSAGKFPALYAMCIAEMLIKDEYGKAVTTLHHLVHDIYLEPQRGEVLDGVFAGMVSYIHERYAAPRQTQTHLMESLDEFARAFGVSGDALVNSSELQQREVQLLQFNNAQVVRQYQETLSLQQQTYSALLGTDNEHALRRFCQLQDAQLYGAGSGSQAASAEVSKSLPPCFVNLHRSLELLDKLPLDPRSRRFQQQQCLLSFHAEYFSLVRSSQQHLFEYALRKALGFAKARMWSEAAMATRPFPPLRPLVVLITWDEFEDDFYSREELISSLWLQRPSFPPYYCAEPRLTEWCDRLGFNVRLINAVLEHHARQLQNTRGVRLSATEKNDRAIRLCDTLRLHSVLYAFRDYLPSLPPHVLLGALGDSSGQVLASVAAGDPSAFDPKQHVASRGQEMEHDLHVLRAYYALRTVLGLMLSELGGEEGDPQMKALTERGEFKSLKELQLEASVSAAAAAVSSSQQTAPVDATSAESWNELSESERKQRAERAEQLATENALAVAQSYVLGMSRVDFQVTTLEKIFCTLFMQRKDVQTQEENEADQRALEEQLRQEREKLARKRAKALAAVAGKRGGKGGKQRENEQDEEISEVESETSAIADLVLMQGTDDWSPMILNGLKCQALLHWMRNTIVRIQESIQSQQRDQSGTGSLNPDPKLMSNYARLEALRMHVLEGIWRLHVIRQHGMTVTMDLMVASLESISIIFLKLDQLEDADLLEHPLRNKFVTMEDLVVAEKWRQLCALVRERARKGSRADVVEGVIEFIADYYKNPPAGLTASLLPPASAAAGPVGSPAGSGADAASASGVPGRRSTLVSLNHVLQGFFFAMDAAITFAHLLSRRAYQTLLDYAIQFLKATRPSHDSPEAQDVFEFYMAYAKHCREHDQNRFALSSPFRMARAEEESGGDVKEAALDSLVRWVDAYRMASWAKKKHRGEPAVDGGWLSSTTGRPEDEVPALPYTSYMTSYQQYLHDLSIASISDNLSDTTLALLAQSGADQQRQMQEEVSQLQSRRSPWRSDRALQYLVQYALKASAEERQRRDDLSQVRPPACLSERLERIRERMHVLARKLMPSLAALRNCMRYAEPNQIAFIARLAREQSVFLPAYARWVEQRASMYERALKILPCDQSGNLVFPQAVRELLSRESIAHDEVAHVQLLEAFLASGEVSFEDKRKALEVADAVINADPHLHSRGEALVQTLLLSLIDDPGNHDHVLRAHSVMRLKDAVWAAQMVLKYVDDWIDPELCSLVLLKVLNELRPAHPLRPRIAFKYNVVVIWQELNRSFPEEKAAAWLASRENRLSSDRSAAPVARSEMPSLLRMFQSWWGFEREAHVDLRRVLLTLLEARQIPTAHQLFQLYRTTKELQEEYRFHLEPQDEDHIADLIEAGNISLQFAPGKDTAERLKGVNMLAKVQSMKAFVVCRHLMYHLQDSQSRFVVMEHLARVLSAGRRAGHAYSSLEEEQQSWLHVAQLSARLVVSLPEELRAQMDALFGSPLLLMLRLLEMGRLDAVRPLIPFWLDFRGIELDAEHKIVNRSSQLADAERSAAGDPNAPLSALARANLQRFNPYSVLLQFARDVLGLRWEDKGKDLGFACLDLCLESVVQQERMARERQKQQERASRGGQRTPAVVAASTAATNVAEAATRLARETRLLAAHCALDAVNTLSAQLGHHDHALFVVHLMKNVLLYFDAQLRPLLVAQLQSDPVYQNILREQKAEFEEFGDELADSRLESQLQAVEPYQALQRFRQYRSLVFTAQEMEQLGMSRGLGAPADDGSQQLPLLFALRRVQFSLDDLLDAMRASELRERLVELDKLDLARRVWIECEGRDAGEFDASVGAKHKNLHKVCQEFDISNPLGSQSQSSPQQS